jgi:PTH1 family peptidyl-tRNA hydrolase
MPYNLYPMPSLIIGLGNPGAAYARNRHNIGFILAEGLAARYRLAGPKQKFSAEVYTGRIGDHDTIVALPQTFMNLSGDAVGNLARFYKIAPGQIRVLHDELDLPPGKIKTKLGGGAAGHNGLKSIDGHIGQDYHRLRFGIGHPGDKNLVSDYVLHDFAKSELDLAAKTIPAIIDNFALWLDGNDKEFIEKVNI